MKLLAFTLRDSKGESYSPPFYAETIGLAERITLDTVNNNQTLPGRHPEDFDLYQVGTFDPQSGQLLGLPSASHIVSCVNLMNANKKGPRGLAEQTT